MSQMLKYMDIFGSEYKFIINDSFSIKSIAGGIMTFLTFAFMIFTMVIFGNDFYYRLNPKVLIQDSIHSEETLYKLNNYTVNNRIIVFKVTKDVDQLNDWLVDGNMPYTFQKEKNRSIMNKCDEDYVLNKFYKDNNDLGKNELKTDFSFYCHSLDSNKFGLQDEDMGAGSILTSPLVIWALDCNKTSGKLKAKTCPSWWNNTQNLDKPYVEVWMESILFNIDDLENPFTPTFTSPGRFFLSQKSQQMIILNLQYHNQTDNLGIFTDTSKISTEVGLGSTKLIVNVPDSFSRPKYRFEAHIGWEKTYKKYSRTYMKVQDLLALVGGVLKAVFTLFQLMSYFFNNFHMTEYILNKLKVKGNSEKDMFNFKNEIEIDLNKSNSKSTVKNDKKDDGKFNLMENNYIQAKIKDFIENKASNHEKLKIDKLDYFKYLFCKNKTIKSLKLFKIADRTRSLEKMIEVYQEITNLKSMLLKEDQLLAFKFLRNIKEIEISDKDALDKAKAYLIKKKNNPGLYDTFLIENNLIKST